VILTTEQAAERERVYHEEHAKALGGKPDAQHAPIAPGKKQQ
jgi:hypothetical protein